MDKLIELLSKVKPLSLGFWWDIRDNGAMIISKEEKNNGHSGEICFVGKEELCGKEYGFIKRLVDNDKINMRKAKYHSDYIYYQDYGEGGWACKDYEFVIMLLSISDNPISDLISYLK